MLTDAAEADMRHHPLHAQAMGADQGTEPPIGGGVRSNEILVSRCLTHRLLTDYVSSSSILFAVEQNYLPLYLD